MDAYENLSMRSVFRNQWIQEPVGRGCPKESGCANRSNHVSTITAGYNVRRGCDGPGIGIRPSADTALGPAIRQVELLQSLAGAFKFVSNQLFIWEDCLIFGGENLVLEIVEGVVGLRCALLRAED